MSLAGDLLKVFGVAVAETIAERVTKGQTLEEISVDSLLDDLATKAEANKLRRAAALAKAKAAVRDR